MDSLKQRIIYRASLVRVSKKVPQCDVEVSQLGWASPKLQPWRDPPRIRLDGISPNVLKFSPQLHLD